ncbi:ATP-binding protein [Haloarculaceae archaeon H-GB2-1]|nr:ATP-binding protein [Haloarculaceae archaeon H-GB2-1]
MGTTDDGFYVADDGCGFDDEDCERVFESGFTTDEHGTGYGLAIVEQIAAAHGWTVTAGNGPDGGARFEFGEVGFVTDRYPDLEEHQSVYFGRDS